jgi:hypothetical protein
MAMLMRYFVVVLLLAFPFSRPASADYGVGHADLVCDPAHNTVLARFKVAEDDDAPQYDKLPDNIDGGLSAKSGTGGRKCTLANGWEIKIRNGEGQVFAYGMGGAAAPNFFSLWVNHRKVISQLNWSEQNYSETEPAIAGVVVKPDTINTCIVGEDKKLSCTAKPLKLNDYQVDTIEYPAPSTDQASPYSLQVSGTDISVCKSIVHHGNPQGMWGRAGEPDLPVPDMDVDWIDLDFLSPTKWEIGNFKNDYGIGTNENVFIQYPGTPLDFDGDGKLDTVIKSEGYSHYFDGSYYVVAPGKFSVPDVVHKLFANGDDDPNIVIPLVQTFGWHVYFGGQTGLYPKEDRRYVHFDHFTSGKMYLLAQPANTSVDPTAQVIKPEADGSFKEICTIQRPRLHY